MKEYDVFLSHSSIDKPWVEEFKQALDAYGITSWLDKDEIAPGELFSQSIETAMSAVKCVVIVVSTDSMESKWVESEYYRALSIINNREKSDLKLIPVILTNAPIPKFLSDRNYINFNEGPYNSNIWKLVWGITGTKPKNVLDVTNHQKQITRDHKSSLNDPFWSELNERLTSMIAYYGLDNDEWASAISSQYFLSNIAKIRGYTSRPDYQRLLNKFLRSFHLQVDNSFAVEKSHILVTPEELDKIVECMRREDEADEYYQRSSKTKWQNIDKWGLHDNYLYGLALDIANDSNYEVLAQVKSAALKRLISKSNGARLDDNGGWYPYRVPWITARILISLHSAGATNEYKQNIDEALESLSLRIYDKKYWKSGVGDWVTKWESTALCLEAFESLTAIQDYFQKIHSVLIYAAEKETEWLGDEPDFSSEENSNKTLSAILLISVILRILKKSPSFGDIDFNISGYKKYFRDCVCLMEKTTEVNVRQFCTIPQIAYYILKSIQ